MYSVTKEFKFDSAHRLVHGYQGKCSNIHGHTWVARFTVAGEELNQFGMVHDFSDFKPIKLWIDDWLDHGIIIAKADETMQFFCAAHAQKHFITEANPTSEHLAKLLLHQARALGVPVTTVEVDETCTSSARYTA